MTWGFIRCPRTSASFLIPGGVVLLFFCALNLALSPFDYACETIRSQQAIKNRMAIRLCMPFSFFQACSFGLSIWRYQIATFFFTFSRLLFSARAPLVCTTCLLSLIREHSRKTCLFLSLLLECTAAVFRLSLPRLTLLPSFLSCRGFPWAFFCL